MQSLGKRLSTVLLAPKTGRNLGQQNRAQRFGSKVSHAAWATKLSTTPSQQSLLQSLGNKVGSKVPATGLSATPGQQHLSTLHGQRNQARRLDYNLYCDPWATKSSTSPEQQTEHNIQIWVRSTVNKAFATTSAQSSSEKVRRKV